MYSHPLFPVIRRSRDEDVCQRHKGADPREDMGKLPRLETYAGWSPCSLPSSLYCAMLPDYSQRLSLWLTRSMVLIPVYTAPTTLPTTSLVYHTLKLPLVTCACNVRQVSAAAGQGFVLH